MPSAAHAQMRAALGALRDVSGVTGSFVFTEAGELVGTDLPAAFNPTFREVAPRLGRLLDASAVLGERARSCVIRFSQHKLYVRPVGDAALAVLFAVHTSLPALKFAANLVARRVEALLAARRERALGPPAAEPKRNSVAPVLDRPSDPGSTSRRVVRFRGRILDEG